MSEHRRLKVLLSAYSCEPGFSSEPGVGWNWAIQIAKYHDVWVLTRETNKLTIEKELEKGPIPGLQFVYYDLPRWMRFWKKGERGLYLYYFLWQLVSLFVACRLHRKHAFDVTHYITFGSVILPTFIFLMPNRIILGPIGGGGRAPLRFLGEFSLRGKLNEVLRHLVQLLYRINPFLYLAFKRADKILLRDKETLNMVPRKLTGKSVLFPETGVPPELLRYGTRQQTGNDLGIVIIGRFLHSKISVLTLKILERFKEKYKQPFVAFIVGDGSEREHLLKFIAGSAIRENVQFTGWLPRDEVFKILSKSDIYMSTSFKEGGSWALFEAITMELPVVCFRTGGPDIVICDECGIKVDLLNPRQVIEDFSDGLLRLAHDRELRTRMAQQAKAHLMVNYGWEEMGRKMNRIYEDIFS